MPPHPRVLCEGYMYVCVRVYIYICVCVKFGCLYIHKWGCCVFVVGEGVVYLMDLCWKMKMN